MLIYLTQTFTLFILDMQMEARKKGKPLKHRGREVRIEDLYLCNLRRVMKGSWVPELRIAYTVES